jgi:hypothetical protein
MLKSTRLGRTGTPTQWFYTGSWAFVGCLEPRTLNLERESVVVVAGEMEGRRPNFEYDFCAVELKHFCRYIDASSGTSHFGQLTRFVKTSSLTVTCDDSLLETFLGTHLAN